MVRMRAEFVDSVARHGRNLQTLQRCLRIVLFVYNVFFLKMFIALKFVVQRYTWIQE